MKSLKANAIKKTKGNQSIQEIRDVMNLFFMTNAND